MQSRREIPQMVGGIAPVRCDTKCVHLTGVGGLTKEKKFNKITDILLIFLLVVVHGGDFSVINPAFFFSSNKKKSIYKVFTYKNLLDFGQLKKAKGFCFSRKTGGTHYLK